MKNDEEDLPVSFLVYVIVALVVIAAIAIGGFILFLR
jgi:hypothetical protein